MTPSCLCEVTSKGSVVNNHKEQEHEVSRFTPGSDETPWLWFTHRAVWHHPETGTKIGQADVAVHIQQHIIGLNIPEKEED